MMNMNASKCCVRLILFQLIAMGFFSVDIALSYDFQDWEHGSAGYVLARDRALEEEIPLVLYFHQSSSELSKKMSDEYLASPDVESFLRVVSKAEIDPNAGVVEADLSLEFGIKEYPVLMMSIPALDVKLEQIDPFSPGRNPMTVDQFLKILKGKIVFPYKSKGHENYEKDEYVEALRYYEVALGFDPADASIYYAMGVIYHILFIEDGSEALFEKAEESYLKALEIDSSHKESKAELEKLREDKDRPLKEFEAGK
jgi:tetratricopeptide (TPR) repeat protein